MNILYTAHGSATGGRNGQGSTDDGKINVALNTPKEMGGSGVGTNPEQLFAVGYAACFLGALQYVGGKAGIKIPTEVKISADVGIGPRDDGQGFGIAVHLSVANLGLAKEAAEDLVAKTHVVCPYSHAVKGNVNVTTTII